MIEIESTNCECLYLHKDNENEIYVDNCQSLKQHQVDSLRFLYRQFKKNKHGAVLNFPPGSGKSLVVTLFLNAISSLLNERVLIICNDDEELEHWKELLLTWTDYKSDDIATEASNPRLKKKIFLKKAEDLNSYLRCHWSVVVIKDENMCKILQKVVLDADLKIWITSTDVKKDVDLLLFIYNWMFPKSNIKINEIVTQVKPHDKMVQTIIMDTFIQDFVIRENKIKVIKETKNSQDLKLYRDNQRGITRKNKDATGNKIKKSKRTIDDTPIIQTNNIPISNISEVKEEPEDERNLTDIEDKSCIQGFPNKQTNNISSNISTEVKEETVLSRNLNNIEYDKDKSCIQVFPTKQTNRLIDMESKSCIQDFPTEQTNNISVISTEVKEEPEISGITDLEDKSRIQSFPTEQTNIQTDMEDKSCVQDFNTEINPQNSDSFSLLQVNQDHTIKIDNIDLKAEKDIVTENSTESLDFGKIEENLTQSLDFDKVEQNSDSTDIYFDDENEDKTVNHENINSIDNDIKMDLNVNSTEKSETNDLDFKMSELEERTMKKFKGSLLDNLF